MKIVRSKKYTKSLQEALKFISLDSRQRALNFKRGLDEQINSLDYLYILKIKNIIDLIFKGYTIVYKINEEKKIITIVGIRNTQEVL